MSETGLCIPLFLANWIGTILWSISGVGRPMFRQSHVAKPIFDGPQDAMSSPSNLWLRFLGVFPRGMGLAHVAMEIFGCTALPCPVRDWLCPTRVGSQVLHCPVSSIGRKQWWKKSPTQPIQSYSWKIWPHQHQAVSRGGSSTSSGTSEVAPSSADAAQRPAEKN